MAGATNSPSAHVFADIEDSAPAAISIPSIEGHSFTLPADMTVNDDQLKALAASIHSQGITSLSLAGHQEVTSDSLVNLQGLSQLQELDLSGTGVTTDGLSALSKLTALNR